MDEEIVKEHITKEEITKEYKDSVQDRTLKISTVSIQTNATFFMTGQKSTSCQTEGPLLIDESLMTKELSEPEQCEKIDNQQLHVSESPQTGKQSTSSNSINHYSMSSQTEEPLYDIQDPVVQSIVSLTISLRHKFVKQISAKVTNTLLFFVEKM